MKLSEPQKDAVRDLSEGPIRVGYECTTLVETSTLRSLERKGLVEVAGRRRREEWRLTAAGEKEAARLDAEERDQ